MIKIITKPNCRWCTLSIDLLKSLDVPVDVVTLTPETRKELIDKGVKTVPYITRGAEVIGGYQELLTYVGTGKI